MNRRRHPRVTVDHPAVIHHQQDSYPDCRILNYSEGGLFLRVAAADLMTALGDGYRPQAQRTVLEIAPEGFARLVRVAVVYVNQGGLGVSFLQPEPLLCDYLQQFAQQTRLETDEHASPSVPLDRESGKLLERLANQTTDYLNAQFDRFLAISYEELITAANRSNENRKQADLFFAINAFETQGARIKREFLNRVAAGFSDMSNARVPSEQPEEGLERTLRLVDKDDFDEWLLLNGITHRLDPRITRSSQKMELVLSRMLHRPVTSEANPGSPISLLVYLQQTLHAEQIPKSVKPILYVAFSKAIFGDIMRLYAQIHGSLGVQGIEPAQVLSGAVKQRHGDSNSIPSTAPDVASPTPEDKTAPAQSMVSGATASPSSSASTPALGQVMSAPIKQSWSLIRQLESLLQAGADGPQAQGVVTPAARDAGEELLASVKQDELLPEPTRELIERLEVPFIKAAVNDLVQLEDKDDAGRRFFQALQGLAPFCSTDQKSARRGGRVAQELAQLFEQIERGELTQITQVTAKIERLQERQGELFERNRKLAIESIKRNEKLREVHRQVKVSLQKLLLGESASVVVDKLFQYGWANLLIQTAMLHTTEGPQWKTYLRVVEILHRLFRSRRTHGVVSEVHKRDLLQIVKRGFAEYPVHPEGAERYIEDLQRALSDPMAADPYIDRRIQIDEHYLAALFVGQMSNTEDRTDRLPVDARWLEQLQRIDEGTWLIQHPRSGETRMVNLAWKTADSKRCLLIDGNGLKVMEASAHRLAREFADENLVLPQGANLSVLDRALQRMLGTTYQNIEQQVSHDELTGLINRRGFERRLNELLKNQLDDTTHVLITLDVDQFGLVNDLCGFEGGDKLLQAITHLLHNYLPPDALLARTGDDEFSVLIPGSNLDQGFQIAETQRQSMDAFKYSWANQLIPVSACLGVVEISDNSRNSGEILKAAAAACSIAKQAGRNCTRVYREEEEAFVEHLQLIKSAANIEDTLARDRILLVAQAIAPLQSAEQPYHYEILLRVLDDNDIAQSPFHFISAAERYDLMRSVDRWVVKHFFSRVEEHLGEIDQLGGFSLNLSGQSVADAEFRGFLKQRITDSPVPRNRLGFEITETAMVKDTREVVRFIEEIRALGCSFYLDDFGSGYASFAYLKDLPVDYVKIDGIFIRGLLDDPTSQTMVKSVTEIAHFMQRRVVAEFVEDQATADLLKEIGIDFIQGYHIARPVPLDEILAHATSSAHSSHPRLQIQSHGQ